MAQAQYSLVRMYESGKAVPDNCGHSILDAQAAEQEVLPAMLKIGDYYLAGEVFQLDLDEARRWFAKAASRGDARANYELGKIYANPDFSESNAELVFFLQSC